MIKKYFAIALLLGALLVSARAQLAITEVVSSGSTNLGAALVTQKSDWWELSNFGTNAINLTGYKWNDNAGGLIGGDSLPFNGLIIQPGESIVFVETVANICTNEAQFRAWWGPSLGAAVQIRFYSGNGLGSGGDGVRLWSPTATTDADVVDSADFLTALRGSSFIYDTNTGVFPAPNQFSTNGVNGAFKAVQNDDIGSPGVNQGPVPLSIAQNPTNLSVNPGDNATFSVVANGIPRPSAQWKFNGNNIAGATAVSFTVTNVQTSKTGLYQVVVFNGFQTLTSSVASLVLNPTPVPPSVITPPEDLVVYIGQSATFNVVATGVPQPRYQWQLNSNNLANATNSSYTISGAVLTNTGVYSVIVTNTLGKLTNHATLTVTPRPNLVITEVCSAESTNGSSGGHNDWWELSNLDTFAVDLYHYQFDDSSQLRAAAYTITNHIIIGPGESIVFVEGMTPKQFTKWWGAVNLKTNLQIIRYDGPNLSLSSVGDAVVLFNPGAADDSDYIAAATFGLATAGVTFGYNPDTDSFGDPTVLGQYGGFQSSESDDLGSPGYIRTPPEPRILGFAPAAGNYDLTWYGLSNRTFAIEYKDDLTNPAWTPLTTILSTGPVSTVNFAPGSSPTGRRFFQLSLLP